MSRSSTLAMCMILCFLAPARAAIITVTSDSGGTGGPDCTLRDAVAAANTDTPTGGCSGGNGADTIELPVDAFVLLTEADNETEGSNGLPSIISEITINGNGATIQREETAPAFRIVHLSFGGHLTLNGVTISGGDVGPNLGGGIRNGGTLTLSSSIVSGNTAVGGGGILNSGLLTLTNSSVTGNSAVSAVGGILNFGGGTVALTNSTVSGNSTTGQAGGIRNLGTLSLTNSTVSGNSGGLPGGGISNAGTLTMTNSTVSGNTANRGGGITNVGTITLTNSIVINNTALLGGGGGILNSGLLTLTNSSVTGNSALNFGGGISNIGDGTVTLTDSTICGNMPDQIDGPWTDNGGNLITDECPPCPSADLNSDGMVNATDLATLLGSWGPCADPCEPGDPGETCPADFDGDCDVGASDLAQLLGSWGPCP